MHWVLLQLLLLVKSAKLHIVIYILYAYIKQVSSLSLTHTINFKAALCATQFVAKGHRQFKEGVKNQPGLSALEDKELRYLGINKVKVVISVHAIEAYRGVEIQLHPLITSADDGRVTLTPWPLYF